jgi:hypothetical protein
VGGHPGSIGPDGGVLDDVRIYNRALSAEEIAELAARPEGLGDLVLHYTFDSETGLMAEDSSPYGNDGQRVNAPLAPGVEGNGVSLDGRTSRVETPSSASLMPDEITLATWVKVDSLPGEVAPLIFKRNRGYNDNEAYSLEVTPAGVVRLALGNGWCWGTVAGRRSWTPRARRCRPAAGIR